MVMINCPKTGTAIPTGIETDRDRFLSSAVFFARTFCPSCRTVHQWFARDGWVHESNLTSSAPRLWNALCSDAA